MENWRLQPINEAETSADLIDPKLKESGWGAVGRKGPFGQPSFFCHRWDLPEAFQRIGELTEKEVATISGGLLGTGRRRGSSSWTTPGRPFTARPAGDDFGGSRLALKRES